jgi:hypothetical protein
LTDERLMISIPGSASTSSGKDPTCFRAPSW